jgi:hypothetical protein
MKIYGAIGAIIELSLFFVGSTALYHKTKLDYDYVSYYWMAFTVLTGIWEAAYVLFHTKTIGIAESLLNNEKHAWFSKYSVTMILPWNLSSIFYAEYAAYADREYMAIKNKWSREIESTHALFCGLFSLLSIVFALLLNDTRNFYICLAVSMGSQLMNSVLYMAEYKIQTLDQYSPNFDCSDFPCGRFYIKRPFMLINIFWTIMPIYIIMYHLIV